MIGRADDRFLVLDDEERVAFVAQVMHDANQAADIARMQADARLVHHEERVHERGAEAGREIDALDFAAAQGARRAIEGEIAEADFAEIGQARDDSRRSISAVESLGGNSILASKSRVRPTGSPATSAALRRAALQSSGTDR